MTITADDLAIWSQFPEATFALYEGASENGDEYRLGSVDLNRPPPDPRHSAACALFRGGGSGERPARDASPRHRAVAAGQCVCCGLG